MPRLKKGARLWFRKARSDERGNTITRGVWIIIDSGRHFRTVRSFEYARSPRFIGELLAEGV